jgi:PAT family beta-lactamase induction signal transducer AmpG
MGWRDFFLLTMAVGIPGLVMLQRFSPFGVRDPEIAFGKAPPRPPATTAGLVLRGALGTAAGLVVGVVSTVLLAAMRAYHKTPELGFDLVAPLRSLVSPEGVRGWTQVLGVLLFALLIGMATAATAAARSGRRPAA